MHNIGTNNWYANEIDDANMERTLSRQVVMHHIDYLYFYYSLS